MGLGQDPTQSVCAKGSTCIPLSEDNVIGQCMSFCDFSKKDSVDCGLGSVCEYLIGSVGICRMG
jgi:hypothetical protein